MSATRAGRLRECVNTEFVGARVQTGFVKAAVSRAVHLQEGPAQWLLILVMSYKIIAVLIQKVLNVPTHPVQVFQMMPSDHKLDKSMLFSYMNIEAKEKERNSLTDVNK